MPTAMRLPLFLALLAGLPSLALAQTEDPPPVEAPPPPPPAATATAAPTAAPPPADPTVHRHLGFFFRADLGVGYLRSSASLGGTSESIASVSIPVGFAVGGAVAENWILAAEVWGGSGPSPRISLGGSSVSPSNSDFYLAGFGLALVHYFMPANVYLSLTPAISRLEFTFQDTSARTDYGFGAKLALGKEWWVGDHWGLGLAAEFLFALNADSGTNSPTWTSFGGGLTFSATFN